MRDSLDNALRHQVAIVVLEARPAIEVDRAVLVAFDFKVERVHSGRTARFVGDVERRGPEPLTASLWLEVELVDEGVAAAIFQTEAERNGEIADDLPA